MILQLKGKRALVGGSSQGIGKAVAIELTKLGASVTLLARHEERLKQVKEELFKINPIDHDYIAVDFENRDEFEFSIHSYLEKKTIDIVVNNTGGPRPGKVIDATIGQFEHAFMTHLFSSHIIMQKVIPHMKKAGYGRIINIISTSVKQPIPGLGVSNTLRAAVANWAKTLSVELASFGITVNNVLPGATKTARLEEIIKEKSIKLGKAIEDIEKEMLHEIPIRRFAKSDEIAYAVAFLASSAADYITGINIPVDGGRTLSL